MVFAQDTSASGRIFSVGAKINGTGGGLEENGRQETTPFVGLGANGSDRESCGGGLGDLLGTNRLEEGPKMARPGRDPRY